MSKLVLCDHQTGYLPWQGLFHRVSLCDVYVSLDIVKYHKSSWEDRNRIKTPEGWKWLKVPAKKGETGLLKDAVINHDIDWVNEHLKSLRFSYANAPYFTDFYPDIEKILEKKHKYLMELNEELFRYFLSVLGMNVSFYRASELGVEGRGNELLINICKKFGADVYVFGHGGKKYAEEGLWKANNIKVYHQSFKHPEYEQVFGDFLPYMSVVDILFNVGSKKARELIIENNSSREQMLREIKNEG